MMPKLAKKAESANPHNACIRNTIRNLMTLHFGLANATSLVTDRHTHRTTTITLMHTPRIRYYTVATASKLAIIPYFVVVFEFCQPNSQRTYITCPHDIWRSVMVITWQCKDPGGPNRGILRYILDIIHTYIPVVNLGDFKGFDRTPL